ncbi:MAG: hypothetical protein RLZZ262_1235 [Bacteroidota bacterium]|jgi:hypothetical protein
MMAIFGWMMAKVNAQYYISAGSSMLHVPDWDRVVHYYNLARTWDEEDLLPLQYGYHAGGGMTFLLMEKRQVFFTPQIRYTRWSTRNPTTQLALHHLTIGPEIRFNPRALLFGVKSSGPLGPRWYIGIQSGLQLWMPRIYRHDEWIVYDEETAYRPISPRIDLKISTGFHCYQIGRWIVTPEISAQLVRGAELYDWSENLLGHNIIGMKNRASSGWNFSAGLIFSHLKKSENWWDRPRGT